ncbi:DUF4149 domain-containing protein [Viridibacterium curvum]|uniref:CopD family protein n=1 Tax=Viridibacterium curvum TaxID=1101404 RepID=A0ABP9R5Q0_9RHOO
MLYDILRSLHVLAIIVWVGGMVLMHFIVRPTVAELLEPPQRLPLMARLLGRFFAWVTVAVVVVLVTGVAMMRLIETGGPTPAVYLHVMMGIGIVMALIFGWIRLSEYPRLRHAVSTAALPVAAASLSRIRRLVALNLALGVLTTLIAMLGRSL